MKAVTKYINKYAESEIKLLSGYGLVSKSCIVIPVFDEDMVFLQQFENRYDSVLIILVLNAPYADNNNRELQVKVQRTVKLLRNIQNKYPEIEWRSDCGLLTVSKVGINNRLMIVDRCDIGELLPIKEGVGLARKIGADIACYLISSGLIESKWIYSTDADVLLPNEYFISNAVKGAAVVYPFIHKLFGDGSASQKIIDSNRMYEVSLNYYVKGLAWAKSIYAFHTIGSCFAVNFKHYAQVRGFPRRSAGEDFYLLNKIVKVGQIISLKKPEITILVRLSDRVPFGTGPAIQKILDMNDYENEFLFYSPMTFECLKDWLSSIESCWENKKLTISSNSNEKILAIRDALSKVNAEENITKALKQCRSKNAFENYMNIWFDGFKTLKFIHYLRNNYFRSKILVDIKKDVPFDF